jgi:hypothetical protein
LTVVFQSTGRDRQLAGVAELMKKLPARYNFIAMPFALSIFMSCLVSLISTLRAYGFAQFDPGTWMQAWGLSWIVAFPALFVVLPFVRKIVGMFVEKA